MMEDHFLPYVLLAIFLIVFPFIPKVKVALKKRDDYHVFVPLWVVTLFWDIEILLLRMYEIPSPGEWFLFLTIPILLLPVIQSFSIGGILGVKMNKLENEVAGLKQTILSISTTNTNIDARITKTYNFGGKLIKTDFKETSDRLTDIGFKQIVEKKYHESVYYLEQSVYFDSENWFSYMLLGFVYDTISPDNKPYDETEMLLKSMEYSKKAIEIDRSHYMQFMNLGLAQQHIGGKKLWQKAIDNFTTAEQMIENDSEAMKINKIRIQRGKCLRFIGDCASSLEYYNLALEHYMKAKQVFDSCEAEPERTQWLEGLDELISKMEKKIK